MHRTWSLGVEAFSERWAHPTSKGRASSKFNYECLALRDTNALNNPPVVTRPQASHSYQKAVLDGGLHKYDWWLKLAVGMMNFSIIILEF